MNSARELSILVLANSPESGRILSMRMSRFSGYSSGASTTGQRSWGKSDSNTQKAWQSQIGKTKLAVSPYRVSLRAYLRFTISPPPNWSSIPRQSVLRKASICSCPTPLAPFCPNSRWESSRCSTSMAMSWKPPSWFPPRSASTYDRRRSGSFCLMNWAAERKKNSLSCAFLCTMFEKKKKSLGAANVKHLSD